MKKLNLQIFFYSFFRKELTRTRAARVGNGFLALTARTVAEAATRAAMSDGW